MSVPAAPELTPASSATKSTYELFLFIAGSSPRSMVAWRNVEAICQQHLAGRYTLTIVDVAQHPARAAEEGLLGLPCLIKKHPGLVRRLVGDFSDQQRVLKALGLPAGQ
ncbi:circadian clock KaiB family protein [Hymenobacter sediminis]|uniref:circadian clock KaiB family protein n=1 Tax=Hymenobacter sediminis TaxID=2218621 RepID=UPI001EE486E1|nr:circadian clock KaiB family protein [Hymenobacter sediminis]